MDKTAERLGYTRAALVRQAVREFCQSREGAK
jgi:hypothetical protein